MAGRDPACIHQAGHLDTGVVRQVGNAAVIQQVATDFKGYIGLDRIYDTRGIFVRSCMGDILIRLQFLHQLTQLFDLVDTCLLYTSRCV